MQQKEGRAPIKALKSRNMDKMKCHVAQHRLQQYFILSFLVRGFEE